MDTIELTLSLSHGASGVDNDPNNPLSRAFGALLADGRSHLAHTLCLYDAAGSGSILKHDLRWLGVFVLSAGDRILLFPGLTVPIDWIDTSRRGAAPVRTDLKLHHLSAEPKTQRWHLTSPGSEDHLAGGRLRPAAADLFFWTGLSVQGDEPFPSARKRTIISHLSPSSDVARRIGELRRLESTAQYSRVSSHVQSRRLFTSSFLHLCILVGRPSAEQYRRPEWLLPPRSPFLP